MEEGKISFIGTDEMGQHQCEPQVATEMSSQRRKLSQHLGKLVQGLQERKGHQWLQVTLESNSMNQGRSFIKKQPVDLGVLAQLKFIFCPCGSVEEGLVWVACLIESSRNLGPLSMFFLHLQVLYSSIGFSMSGQQKREGKSIEDHILEVV